MLKVSELFKTFTSKTSSAGRISFLALKNSFLSLELTAVTNKKIKLNNIIFLMFM